MTTQISINGKQVEVEPVEFDLVEDGSQTIQLADGTKIRLKLVVTSVFRPVAHDGDPKNYYVQAATIVVPAETE